VVCHPYLNLALAFEGNFLNSLLARRLGWYHLAKKKCKELCCMIARGREAEDTLLNSLKLKLWHGKAADTISLLEAYPRVRGEDTKNMRK
jgi:hypothetical protein